ncbi:MAG: hypothetical protein ACYDH6_12400 [Acidimicrobiales bacterium]
MIALRAKAIGIVVLGVCGVGVVGMIVTSATHHNGAAITFGLITAVAILCQMTATTVTNELRKAPGAPITTDALRLDDDAVAIEDRIVALVETGAEEAAVRDLVRRAVRLGREGRARR